MGASTEQLDAFAAAARRVAGEGLVRCSSGNLSWRIDDELMLLTASGAWMADLTTDQVAICRLADGAAVNDCTPSAEVGFHTGVLRGRPDVDVVLHCQSPAATAVACCDPEKVNFSVILEIPHYIGPVAVIPYIQAGTARLAEAVVSAMKSHDVANLHNHGQVVVGTDFSDTIQKAVFFELACEIILRGGDRIQPMSDADVAHLRELARERGRRGV